MTLWRVAQVLIVLVVTAVLAFRFLVDEDGAGPSGVAAPPPETRIEVDTPELARAKAEAGIEACPRVAGSSDLPPVTLACLGGGEEVALNQVEGPAVVNLWASWCGPCKEELPLLGRLDDEAGNRLTVLGVDYQDPRPDGALELAARSGVTFPQLADPGGSLADELRIVGMPGTLYVDADGSVTFVNRAFTSYAELTALVRDHTGVDVTAG
jgi:cytochrome c biogenesis protein CcmG, thiol:disulfide interchange protein DsbE